MLHPPTLTIRPHRPISDLGFTLAASPFGGVFQSESDSENGPVAPTGGLVFIAAGNVSNSRGFWRVSRARVNLTRENDILAPSLD